MAKATAIPTDNSKIMNLRFNTLFHLYIDRRASVAEQQEFYVMVHSGRYDAQLRQLLEEVERQDLFYNTATHDFFKTGADLRMLTAIFNKEPNRVRYLFLRKYWMPIAVGLTACLVLVWGVDLVTDWRSVVSTASVEVAQEILPGKTGATLILSDGRHIRLADSSDGQLAQESGLTIRKTADGQLIYELSSVSGIPSSSAVDRTYNSLSTARGETYQVRLPDGTLVYLNASSRLSYSPVLLQEGKRHVHLEGEGYFEVAHDKRHPFVVRTSGQEIEVLGTHFNVSAYPDETIVYTTLLEGQVRVRPAVASQRAVLLQPGEQSQVSANTVQVKQVVAEDAISWKNGYFQFREEPLESIMRKVVRWYNVDIEYSDDAPMGTTFNGTISRYAQVLQVLRKLELTNAVRFKIRNHKIIVER